MEFLLPTPAELAATLLRGPSFWHERGYRCGEDALPPRFILAAAALDDPDDEFWLTPRLLVHDGEILGAVTFKSVPGEDGQIEIGYAVAAACQGRGFASRAVSAIVAEAFSHPSITWVTAHTTLDNAASMRVLEKCGFVSRSLVITDEGETVRKFSIRRTSVPARAGAI